MKNSRGLMALVIASMLGLFSTFAFAQQASKDDILSWKQSQKIKLARKSTKAFRPVSCSLYADGSYYLIGIFLDPYNSDRFTRKGLSIGNGCYYTRNWFRVGMGAEFYDGSFAIDHIEPGLNGSFSFDDIGLKEWFKTALLLNGVEIGLTVGTQKSVTSRLKVKDLFIASGGGWFDFGSFVSEELLSTVNLKLREVGINAVVPLNRNTSLTFDLLWQDYKGSIDINFTAQGKEVLEFLDYPDLANKGKVDISTSLFYLTPGIERCWGKTVCAEVAIPWGVFASDVWALGGEFKLELKY